MIENYSKLEVVVSILQAEGVSQSEILPRLGVFIARMFSAERSCPCSATNLNMAEWH
jgi:hypothetical protein